MTPVSSQHWFDDMRLLDKTGSGQLRVYALLSADQTDAIRKGPAVRPTVC